MTPLLRTIPSHSSLSRFAILARSHAVNQPLEARGIVGSVCSSVSQLRRASTTLPLSAKSSSSLLPVSTGTIVSVVASLACSTLCTTTNTTTALCDNDKDDSGDEDIIAKIRSKLDSMPFPDLKENATVDVALKILGSQISTAVASGIPTDLSYGFFAGYFSGLALKKIGKVASVTLGMSFLALQTLAYHGYIEVHHEKLQSQVEQILDRNNDGVVDGDDLKSVLEDVKKVAGFGLEDNNTALIASGGGFTMGFWGGLKSG